MPSTSSNSWSATAAGPARKKRVLILGGGFGGVYTARHLERHVARSPDVEIVLVSRDNFFVMTPLLFAVCSGTLDMRHVAVPIRAFLRTTRFIEATVQRIDLARRTVQVSAGEGETQELPYDQLVLALGAMTNLWMIPGSETALTFKTLADALFLRNHVIERFEQADGEIDPVRKRRLLTFVIVGAGLVGIELLGELTAFVDEIVRLYRGIDRDEVQFILLQAGDRIMPEMDSKLADYAARLLGGRRGVHIRTHAPAQLIEPGKVHLAGEIIESATIVLAAGIVPSPIVADLQLEKDKHGHVVVEPTMRCPDRPEIWALGDCAMIPGPDGKPYPALAQHALREARLLARNLHAVLHGQQPQPFIYSTMGMMASLGHNKGLAQMLKVRVRGFVAWWVRRSYYLSQMPGWSRRLRIMIDWTFALFFRPDIVKLDLAREAELHLRNQAAGAPHPAVSAPTRPLVEQR